MFTTSSGPRSASGVDELAHGCRITVEIVSSRPDQRERREGEPNVRERPKTTVTEP